MVTGTFGQHVKQKKNDTRHKRGGGGGVRIYALPPATREITSGMIKTTNTNNVTRNVLI